jgi:head-tail adaptor
VVAPGVLSISQAQAARYLPEVGQVQRPTTTRNRYGEEVRSWANVGGTVPCRIGPMTRRDQDEYAGRYADLNASVMTLPADTDIRARDRVVVAGRTFEVEQDNGPHSYDITRRVVVVER